MVMVAFCRPCNTHQTPWWHSVGHAIHQTTRIKFFKGSIRVVLGFRVRVLGFGNGIQTRGQMRAL